MLCTDLRCPMYCARIRLLPLAQPGVSENVTDDTLARHLPEHLYMLCLLSSCSSGVLRLAVHCLLTVVATGNFRSHSNPSRRQCRSCPCATCIWLLHPAPILVPKMVLTLCNLRWWCFSFHQLAKLLHLQSWSSSPAATCAGGVFPRSTSTFTNVRTNE